MSMNGYFEGLAQYEANKNHYLNNPSRTLRDSLQDQARKETDVPILLYEDKYIKNPGLWVDKLRQVRDTLLLNPNPLYGFGNPNQPYLYDIVKGRLRPQDYEGIDRLFGDASPIPIVDNHFFDKPRKLIKGMVMQQQFQFGVKQINTRFAKEQIEEAAEMGSRVLMQGLLSGAQDNGMELSFARDKKVPLPQNAEDLMQFMNGQEQVETIIHKLLQHTDYNHSFQDVAMEALDHKFTVNAQFGYVKHVNGQVIPMAYHPDAVRCICTKPVKTFEDPNVLAAAVLDYMTPNELINEFQSRLQTGTGIQGIINYFDQIQKKEKGYRNLIGYDTQENYWTEEGISSFGMGSKLNNLNIQGYSRKEISWMNNMFYPTVRGVRGLTMMVMVMRAYAWIIKEQRYIVDRIEADGKIRPATDKELDAWHKNNHDRNIELRFTEVDEKNKGDLKRKNVQTSKRRHLHQFTSLGHNGFINVGDYEFLPEGADRAKVGMPIVAQISYEKSMAKLGERDAIKVNQFYQALDMYMANLGYNEAIILDDTAGEDDVTFLYNFRKTGIVKLDSSWMQPNNQAQLKHLQTVQLSSFNEDIQNAFRQIDYITSRYETNQGLGPQVQGVQQDYSGLKETQLNIANQQLLLRVHMREHDGFMGQMLQRSADILKYVHAVESELNVVLTNGERETLRLVRKIALADFDIRLISGQLIEDDMKIIQQIVQLMAQSGGAEDAEALLSVALSKIPSEGMAIFRKLMENKKKQAEASAQASEQSNQIMAQLKEQENQLKILIEKMKTEREMMVQELKNQQAASALNADGLKKDIGAQNKREEMLLNAGIAQNQAAFEQAQSEPESVQQAVATT